MNTGASVGLQLATNIGLSMAFVSSFYILFYIKERVTGAKHLQYVSGAEVSTLWSISFVWDYIIFIFINICLVLTLSCYQEEGYSTVSELGNIFIYSIYIYILLGKLCIILFFRKSLLCFDAFCFCCFAPDIFGFILV